METGSSKPGPEEQSIYSIGHLFLPCHDQKIHVTSALLMPFEQKQHETNLNQGLSHSETSNFNFCTHANDFTPLFPSLHPHKVIAPL